MPFGKKPKKPRKPGRHRRPAAPAPESPNCFTCDLGQPNAHHWGRRVRGCACPCAGRQQPS